MDIHFNGGKKMNPIVDKGKTLIVDGPASVAVTSGKAKVFGTSANAIAKIVIREGKRLPFAVEEKAEFDISLSETGRVEEVEGNTIPPSWLVASEELRELHSTPAVVLVLGTTDSGKTSFCTFLINMLVGQKKKVAILDGDLGQSDVGPPCSVAYTFVTKPTTDLFNLRAKNAAFIGSTSPSGVGDKVIDAITSLKKEVVEGNPDFIIVNSDGWIDGEEAVKFKVQLAERTNPDIVVCIRKKDELTLLLDALKKFRKCIVETPSVVYERTIEKRKNLRELGYGKYLRSAKIQSFPFGWLKIEDNGLLGLGKAPVNHNETKRISDLLGMKPLHFSEQTDRIHVIIGRKRWISAENLKKTEEAMKKRVLLIRKGEEEGMLIGLYNGKRKFLGVGTLHEIDYVRRTIKIMTPVSSDIAIATIGKVKLDKNYKEIPTFGEIDQTELAGFSKLF